MAADAVIGVRWSVGDHAIRAWRQECELMDLIWQVGDEPLERAALAADWTAVESRLAYLLEVRDGGQVCEVREGGTAAPQAGRAAHGGLLPYQVPGGAYAGNAIREGGRRP